MNKIWKIKGREELLSDEELIHLIKKGKIDKNAAVATKDMKHHIKLCNSIYQFYFKKGVKDETIQ